MNESPRHDARDPQSDDGLFGTPTSGDAFSFDDLDSHWSQNTVSDHQPPVDSEPVDAEAIEWADDDDWVDPEDAFDEPLLLGARDAVEPSHHSNRDWERTSSRRHDEPPRDSAALVKGMFALVACVLAILGGVEGDRDDRPDFPEYPYVVPTVQQTEPRDIVPFEKSPFYTSGQDIWESRPDGLLPRQNEYETVGSTAPFLPDEIEADPLHASAVSLFPEVAPLTPPPQRGPFDELQFDSDPLFGGTTETASDFAFTSVTSSEVDSSTAEVVPASNQFIPPRVASPTSSSANTPMRPARSEAPLLPDLPSPLE